MSVDNHSPQDNKRVSKVTEISRRTFLAGLAGLTSLGFVELPMQQARALPQFDPFSFIFVSDCHLVNGLPDTGEKLLQESQLFLQEAIKQFNVLKPDFVLFGGDMVETVGKDETNWLLFGDIVQSLQVPWSFVLGERDVSGKVPPDKMRTFGADWKARGIESTTPYWSLNPVAGVHLVGLDSSVPNNDGGNISEEQLTWLKSDLSSNKGKLTVVFSHHPLLPPPPYDGGPPWGDYATPNGADVRELLSSDVRLVVSGHLYMNKIQLERDVWHISCAGLDIYPCQFKLVRVSRTGVVVESFAVNFPALVKKGRKALIDSTLSYKYDSKDREAFLRLCEGGREDQDAFLALTGAKGPQPLSKKDKQNLDSTKGKEEGKEKGKKKGKDAEKGKSTKGKNKDSKESKGSTKEKEKEKEPAKEDDKQPPEKPEDESKEKPLDQTEKGTEKQTDTAPKEDSKDKGDSGKGDSDKQADSDTKSSSTQKSSDVGADSNREKSEKQEDKGPEDKTAGQKPSNESSGASSPSKDKPDTDK